MNAGRRAVLQSACETAGREMSYLVIDMTGELQLELAVPVAAPVTAGGRVRPGTLPEGRYAVLRHTGPYDGLLAQHLGLLGLELGIGEDALPVQLA